MDIFPRVQLSGHQMSHINMLENHWACFLTKFEIYRRIRNRELARIALMIRKKAFLKVLNKPIILKYPPKAYRTNQNSEAHLEPS